MQSVVDLCMYVLQQQQQQVCSSGHPSGGCFNQSPKIVSTAHARKTYEQAEHTQFPNPERENDHGG